MNKFLFLLLLAAAGCSSSPRLAPVADINFQAPNQELIVDPKIQMMGRNEVIDAVRQCETSGLRAIPIYAKRKVSGYSVETIVEVTCGPKYPY